MDTPYIIEGQNESAVINMPFDSVRNILLQDNQWAAHVLQSAGKGSFTVGYAKAYGAVFRSSVVRQAPGYLLIRGTAGKNARLMYDVRAIDDETTRITPAGKTSTFMKIVVPIGLMMLCLIPVIFTPLAYWGLARGMKRLSAKRFGCALPLPGLAPGFSVAPGRNVAPTRHPAARHVGKKNSATRKRGKKNEA